MWPEGHDQPCAVTNHRLIMSSRPPPDAEAAVTMRVTEHLLRVIYELPGLAPPVR